MNKFSTKSGLQPVLRDFHGVEILSFNLGFFPYFSVSHIAKEMEIEVFNDFDLIEDFLAYGPMVVPDIYYTSDQSPDVFMPVPAFYGWLMSKDRTYMPPKTIDWIKNVWSDVEKILDTPQMQKATEELFNSLFDDDADKLFGGIANAD